jgi:hypothetical protein
MHNNTKLHHIYSQYNYPQHNFTQHDDTQRDDTLNTDHCDIMDHYCKAQC